MEVCRTFISFVFLTLQNANTGLCNAAIPTHTGMEGGNITVECLFYIFGRSKLLCKDKCEENVLIRTTRDTAQRGRFSMTYKEESLPTRHSFIHVSITELQKSDSGLYRCYLDRHLDRFLYVGFQLNVTEATLEPTLTVEASGFLLPVVISVTSVVLVVLVMSVALICKKKSADTSGLNRSRNLDYSRTQAVLYENAPLVSLPKDSVYESLDAATRNQDQLYFTLRDARAQMNVYK